MTTFHGYYVTWTCKSSDRGSYHTYHIKSQIENYYHLWTKLCYHIKRSDSHCIHYRWRWRLWLSRYMKCATLQSMFTQRTLTKRKKMSVDWPYKTIGKGHGTPWIAYMFQCVRSLIALRHYLTLCKYHILTKIIYLLNYRNMISCNPLNFKDFKWSHLVLACTSVLPSCGILWITWYY